VTGATGTGATGPTGLIGATGPTGLAGSGSGAGEVALFLDTSNVSNNECIGNSRFNTNQSAACPSPAAAADSFTSEIKYLEGPVPAGGGTVSNIEALIETPVTGAQTWTIEVVDNTTGSSLLSCTINTTTSLSASACRSTGSAAVAAGHYLEVRSTKSQVTPVPGDRAVRVSFRY
jgi:hypothetical protein